MARYNVHAGQFPCHTCGTVVTTIRSYPNDKKVTWMCPDKHLNEVSFETKKSKADYEREG